MSRYRKILPGIMRGAVAAPPSKSVTHRLFIIAALSGKRSVVRNPLWSEDTHITLDALKKMGFICDVCQEQVVFTGERYVPEKPVEIYLSNSGTSARLLTALAAALPGEYHLDGTPRMRERPMAELIEALQQLGVDIDHHNGHFPLRIHGNTIAGGKVTLDASKSSQFLSALLLIAPLTIRGLEIIVPGEIASRAYVDLTLSLLKKSCIRFTEESQHFIVSGSQSYHIEDVTVEGDYSNASYFAIGAAISGGEVHVRNLDKDSWQGDKAVLAILESAGARVSWNESDVTIAGSSLTGIDYDMHRYPDLVPGVAVMALFARSKSRLQRVGHLRYKESDRLSAILENIQRLGGKAFVEKENLIIQPKNLKGSTIATYNDHRMAMSFSLAGLRIPGVQIENPKCVEKSFPNFWQEFDRLVQPV